MTPYVVITILTVVAAYAIRLLHVMTLERNEQCRFKDAFKGHLKVADGDRKSLFEELSASQGQCDLYRDELKTMDRLLADSGERCERLEIELGVIRSVAADALVGGSEGLAELRGVLEDPGRR